MGDRSLAELAGHNLDAQQKIAVLLDRYRLDGIAGLRAEAEQLLDMPRMPTAREFQLAALIVEAVLTIAESRSPRIARWVADVEEERAEIERDSRGGGR